LRKYSSGYWAHSARTPSRISWYWSVDFMQQFS
jgi:hypothetical protein